MEFAATIWNKAPAMAAVMQSKGISVPQLAPEQMADIVAYLYSVRYFASGNVQQGYGVASQKGCLNCHVLRGERGKPASDLTKVKGLDSPAAALAALWNHALVTPHRRREEAGLAGLRIAERWPTSSRCSSPPASRKKPADHAPLIIR